MGHREHGRILFRVFCDPIRAFRDSKALHAPAVLGATPLQWSPPLQAPCPGRTISVVISMRIVGIRRFRQQTATLLQDMQRRKEALLLTRHGQPVGVVLPVDGEAGEDLILACHPHWQRAWDEARREIARGEYVTLRELRARAKER